MKPEVRVGVDIGGTFTDVALEVGDRLHASKTLTTHDAPERGSIQALVRAAGEAGVALGEIDSVIHGTTLATNALIERRGAHTAFVTSAGFRDVIEMRTENRFEQYDLNIVLPEPLVPREDRLVVGGRIAASGRELAPFDAAGMAAVAEQIAARGYQSVAIGFMHAYANTDHERRARDLLAARVPEVKISISSEVSPQMREFERFNTVCANAFIKPLMASYLGRLVSGLRAAGANCPVFMIHSGGGLISVETAVAFPVRLLESGPAGGAIYAAEVAARYRLDQVLSYDMGGTTAKICLIEGQQPKTARSFEVARTYRFKKGSGMPISIPVIEMVEIGAGGGSLASVDRLRQIRVGPESAGSEPGPACYGRGGERPAVTDADLVLGRLDPNDFAGGDIRLAPDRAAAALAQAIGEPLGMTAPEAAIGVCEVVDENMANAARVHAVENGKDLAEFTMIAFGGAAPIHACRLCDKLGIGAVLIPPGAGVGSAIGFLRAPFGFEAVRGAYLRLSQYAPDRVNRVLGELTDEAERFVRSGAPHGDLETERKAYMRYAGQGWEIAVPLPERTFGPDDGPTLRTLFEAEYTRLFGRALDGVDVEVMNWAVRVSSTRALAIATEPVAAAAGVDPEETRPFYDARRRAMVTAAVVQRDQLTAGARVAGPAAIVEAATTTIVTSDYEAIMQADGCLLVRRCTP